MQWWGRTKKKWWCCDGAGFRIGCGSSREESQICPWSGGGRLISRGHRSGHAFHGCGYGSCWEISSFWEILSGTYAVHLRIHRHHLHHSLHGLHPSGDGLRPCWSWAPCRRTAGRPTRRSRPRRHASRGTLGQHNIISCWSRELYRRRCKNGLPTGYTWILFFFTAFFYSQ